MSPDNKSSLFSTYHQYQQTFVEVEHRLKIFVAENDGDMQIKHLAGSFKWNTCNFMESSKKNLILRILTQSLTESSRNVTCPIPKGTRSSLVDIEITDKYSLPAPVATNYRLEDRCLGKIKGQKKFREMYLAQYHFTVQK
jgi:hypothetical protein